MTVSCPLPPGHGNRILLSHGSGGRMTSQLIDSLFLSAFGDCVQSELDSALLTVGEQKLAFTTDSYVVHPLFFPGGNIGDLAVNGTVNDLAVSGARPLYLSCGFILEEGLDKNLLLQIARSMREAADSAAVKLVTGDTKVVEKGKGDGVYINTSGIGVVERVGIEPRSIQSGDAIIVSGDIGRHGTAIMSVREGFTFESTIESDTQELSSLVTALIEAGVAIHCLRDLTRGGLATVLAELAKTRGLTFAIDEEAVPINDVVRGACEFLGLDPLYVACEGRLVAFVPPKSKEQALTIMRQYNDSAETIGTVVESSEPIVTAKTFLGTRRILNQLVGDQLPRIC